MVFSLSREVPGAKRKDSVPQDKPLPLIPRHRVFSAFAGRFSRLDLGPAIPLLNPKRFIDSYPPGIIP